VLPNGDMSVAPILRGLVLSSLSFEESEVSTIHRVNFAPLPSSLILTPHNFVSASQPATTGDGIFAQAGCSAAGAGSQSRKRKGKAKRGLK
jgi:hypothetical protein